MKLIYTPSIKTNVLGLTTTKDCGNMGYQLKDYAKNVLNNRKALSKAIGIPLDDFVFTHQTHSTILKEVTSKDKGRGKLDFEDGIYADALYTKEKGIPLCIFHADCTPVFFYSKTQDLVGIIHSGVKGTVNEIVFKSLLTIITNEHVDPRDLYVHLGPSLSSKYQKVDEESRNFLLMHGYEDTLDMLNFDKPKHILKQLDKLGIPKENITVDTRDTFTDESLFSAHEKTNDTGRMISLIYLK